MAQPEQSIGEQEIGDLPPAVIVDQRVPVEMEAEARVGVLVQVGAIEIAEPVRIGRKMARHPVQQQADAAGMAAVDEARERRRIAVAAGRGEQPDRLVAPRAVERILRDRQQLEMGEAHLGDVRHQPLGELVVGEIAVALLGHAHPGAEMALVDRDRRVARARRRARGQPRAIRPGRLAEPVHDRGGARRMLGGKGEGVRLERQQSAPGTLDLVLVHLAAVDPRDEQLPHAAFDAFAHGMAPAVPAVEGADHGHPLRVRRPHQERDAGDAVQLHRVRAEPFVQPEVIAFGDEIGVQLAEDRREAIGIVDFDGVAATDLEAQAIGERRCAIGHVANEQPVGMRAGHLADRPARPGIDQPHPPGVRLEGAHHQAAGVIGMGAEHAERIAVVTARQRVDRGAIERPFPRLSPDHRALPPAPTRWSRL